MTVDEVIARLKSMANPEAVRAKQEKFGISAERSLGLYHRDLKVIADEIGTDNELAQALFDSGIYEARLLCCYLYDYRAIAPELMEKWVSTFENWEICDSFCMSYMAKTPYAVEKALEWSAREPEFEKRAGFVMVASYCTVDKKAGNEVFEQFLPVIEREATDERLYVKKAVNWALRNVGKRNVDLQARAIATARSILDTDSKAAKWTARNALKELEKPSVRIADYPRAIYRPKQ